MERKRKLPARAAARVEHVAKKRTVTPPERRSETPASASTPPPAPATATSATGANSSAATPQEPPVPSLPRSVQPGKLLPTVEDAQHDDLPLKEYQNIQESGVLAESITRSRQRWIAEGMFEKYWAKPTKKKGVVTEEPNNPPKDSMSRVGHVTISIEPHVFEATMYVVKDPKPSAPAPTTQATFRPIMQYGPPNGSMPPPPTPKPAATASPSATPVASVPETSETPKAVDPSPDLASVSKTPTQPAPAQQAPLATTPSRGSASAAEPARTTPIPQGNGPVLAPAPNPSTATNASSAPQSSPAVGHNPHTPSPAPAPSHASAVPGPTAASPATPANPPAAPAPSQPANTTGPPNATPSSNMRAPNSTSTPTMGASKPATAASATTPKAPGTDPIIMTLAEKASEDPHLRDLMKRVAAGEAKPDELTNFQRIIDQITAEYKRKGGQQGPSADRLVVDGKTVKYFSDEVRTILDIVLATNPQQKSSELIPPQGSDPLVVALVKSALDDPKVSGMIRRIADNQPGFTDATDLKANLDKLLKGIQTAPPPRAPPTPAPAPAAPTQAQAQAQAHTPASKASSVSAQSQPNGTPNGSTTAKPAGSSAQSGQPSQQALRSKGPPPPPKPDISAVVFEFAGGNGDRYLFPKFSILEYMPGGQQVIASFLIVRKGSNLEYGGDEKLDYYQPVTIRLFSQNAKFLDHLQRVVAAQEEVRRYMDDVMDNMTRAEYVLLAMRLPRAPPVEAATEDSGASVPNGNGTAEVIEPVLPPKPAVSAGPSKPAVLWRGGPNVSKFKSHFDNKKQFEDFVSANKQKGGARSAQLAYENARSLLGLNEADYADYDKIIEGLAAKDSDESA